MPRRETGTPGGDGGDGEGVGGRPGTRKPRDRRRSGGAGKGSRGSEGQAENRAKRSPGSLGQDLRRRRGVGEGLRQGESWDTWGVRRGRRKPREGTAAPTRVRGPKQGRRTWAPAHEEGPGQGPVGTGGDWEQGGAGQGPEGAQRWDPAPPLTRFSSASSSRRRRHHLPQPPPALVDRPPRSRRLCRARPPRLIRISIGYFCRQS